MIWCFHSAMCLYVLAVSAYVFAFLQVQRIAHVLKTIEVTDCLTAHELMGVLRSVCWRLFKAYRHLQEDSQISHSGANLAVTLMVPTSP